MSEFKEKQKLGSRGASPGCMKRLELLLVFSINLHFVKVKGPKTKSIDNQKKIKAPGKVFHAFVSHIWSIPYHQNSFTRLASL